MKINILIILFFAFFSTDLLAQYESVFTVEKHILTIKINADGTYTETEEELDKIETLKGIDALSQASFSYTKNMQTLEILDAYTIKPNGTKIKVTKEGIREKEDSLSDGADSFSDVKHKIIIFPDVTVGSKVYSKTREKTFKTKFKNQFYFYLSSSPYHKVIYEEINFIVKKPLHLNIDNSGGFNGGLIKETKDKLYYKYTYSQDLAIASEDNMVSLPKTQSSKSESN